MVDLSYKKVIENINALKEYDEKHPFYQNNNENENEKNEESKLILNENNQNENKLEEEKRKEENKEKENKEKENEEIENKEKNEKDIIVENYKNFLDNSYKSFKMLFLCHTAKKFIELMKNKGIEIQNKKNEEKKEPIKIVIKKNS